MRSKEKTYHGKKTGDRPMTNKISRTWRGQLIVTLCDFKLYVEIDLQYIKQELKLEFSCSFLVQTLLNKSSNLHFWAFLKIVEKKQKLDISCFFIAKNGLNKN